MDAALVLAIAAFSVNADISRSSSRPFTFPGFSAVVQQGVAAVPPSYFKFLHNSAGAKVMGFAWSFPMQSGRQRGATTIYSLRGQAIRVIPIASPAGMVQWNAAREAAAGIYIARLVYGSVRQNLRLMLCN